MLQKEWHGQWYCERRFLPCAWCAQVMRTGVKGGARSVCWNKGYFFIFMPERYCRSQKKKHLKTCLHLTEWLAIKIWGRNLEDFWETIFLACVLMLYISNPWYHLWKLIKKRMSHAYYFLKKSNTIFYFLGGGLGLGVVYLYERNHSHLDVSCFLSYLSVR